MPLPASAAALAFAAIFGSASNPSEDASSGAIPAPSRDQLLVTPAPYPLKKVDSPLRARDSRLWAPRWPVGTRTPIGEQVLGFPGPAGYGASPEATDQMIVVRTREPLPLVAISPFMKFDQSDIELIKRQQPWIRRQDTIRRDIQRAQNVWLQENGYILAVRTHVNPKTYQEMQGSPAAKDAPQAHPAAQDIQPRAVIRVLPEKPATDAGERAEAAPAPSTVRVSMPAHAVTKTIRVETNTDPS